MTTLLLFGLALATSAPAPKDAPKNESTIVGEWVVDSMTLGGLAGLKSPAGVKYEFTGDGHWLIHRGGGEARIEREYKLDSKTDPPSIDVSEGIAKPRVTLGIYRLEGNTLTLCFAGTGEADRPKTFESPAGSRVLLLVLKKVKKRE
jgi:uncharacterized protein (TIGR03067 family)